MAHKHHSYKVTITPDKFEKSATITDETAHVVFFDHAGKESGSHTFGVLPVETLYKGILNGNIPSLVNCYIADFSVEKYKEYVGLAIDAEVVYQGIDAENSFWDSKESISFEKIRFSHTANFLHATFAAPSIKFTHCNFECEDVNFEYTTFIGQNVSFAHSVFADGETNFKHALFNVSHKYFNDMHFGMGALLFINTEFGDGDISFANTIFSQGRTSFKVARFGKGKKDFNHAFFNDGETTFERTFFGDGDVSFRSVRFGEGKKDFTRAEFGQGDKSFVNTEFGKGNVSFKNVDFGKGDVSFKLAIFEEGAVDYHFSVFREGDVKFDYVKFKDGQVNFKAVNFGNGRISFTKSEFGNGDIILDGSKKESGVLHIKKSVFGNGAFSMQEAEFQEADLLIEDVDFGQGKVSFLRSQFNLMSLKESQIDNYFDLRLLSCNMLDLSETIVKDIIDLESSAFHVNIRQLNLAGMRLLGQLRINWYQQNVKELIYNQDTDYSTKSEQFRVLKENYNSIGQYSYEDEAYIEFKRTELEAFKENNRKKGGYSRFSGGLSYYFQKLLFDKVGHYATDPVRVLLSMLLFYLTFGVVYTLSSLTGAGDILYGIGDQYTLSVVAEGFYFSAITFLTIGYGDFYPIGLNRILAGVEGFSGLFLMSYFTVAFVRKLLR